MKQSIKIGSCLLLASVAVMLAGCGSHDQSSPAGGGGTPQDVVQKARQQGQAIQNQPPATGQTAPATH